MQLTDEELREFAKIWERTFREVIPLDEARDRASDLMELVALLIQANSPAEGGFQQTT